MFLIPEGGVLAGGGLTLATLITGGILIKVGAARMTHEHTMTTQEGYVGTDDLTSLIGQTGTTSTVLRPGGFANIGGKRGQGRNCLAQHRIFGDFGVCRASARQQ